MPEHIGASQIASFLFGALPAMAKEIHPKEIFQRKRYLLAKAPSYATW
jgi:hypothetical protein